MKTLQPDLYVKADQSMGDVWHGDTVGQFYVNEEALKVIKTLAADLEYLQGDPGMKDNKFPFPIRYLLGLESRNKPNLLRELTIEPLPGGHPESHNADYVIKPTHPEYGRRLLTELLLPYATNSIDAVRKWGEYDWLTDEGQEPQGNGSNRGKLPKRYDIIFGATQLTLKQRRIQERLIEPTLLEKLASEPSTQPNSHQPKKNFLQKVIYTLAPRV